MFWNSSIGKLLRYILVVPFQITMLGIYTWGVSTILIFILGLLIGKSWWLIALIMLPLLYLYEIVEYFIFLLQVIFNFSSIKISPNKNFGKITLFCIGLIYTIYVFYGLWFKEVGELGIFAKIVMSYLYIHFVTKGIILMTTVNEFYENMDNAWRGGMNALGEKFSRIFGKRNHRKDSNIIEEVNEDIVAVTDGINVQRVPSSGIQFLFIFGIIGFGLAGIGGSTIAWIISVFLLVGIIFYTKYNVGIKGTGRKERNSEKHESSYFIIPFWRFFLMQFFTGGLYAFYWMGKNISFITGKNVGGFDLGFNWGYSIYTHLLGKFWKSKILINIISLILGLWMLILPLITVVNLFVNKNIYGFGFLQFGNLIELLQSLGDIDFKYGLLILSLLSFMLLGLYFPFLLAQRLMKKLQSEHQKFTYAKFGIFEILVYITGIILAGLIFFGKWDGYLISEEDGKSEIISSNTKNPELIKYTSNTGSFEVMAPEKMEYNRIVNNEDGTIETIDAYKTTLKNEDVVFMIIHDNFKGKLNLQGFSVKEAYNNFIKSYTVKEEKSYKEIDGEAHFEILVEYEKQNIYFHGRIIKKNNNEIYTVYSAFSDLTSSNEASKFINSFKFTGQK